MKRKIVLLLFATIVAYAIWNGRNFLLGPQIDIFEPEDGIAISSQTFFMKGRVKNASFISLSGRQIFTDSDGLFSEEILPTPGYNVLELEVRDRFGKKITERRTFYYE